MRALIGLLLAGLLISTCEAGTSSINWAREQWVSPNLQKTGLVTSDAINKAVRENSAADSTRAGYQEVAKVQTLDRQLPIGYEAYVPRGRRRLLMPRAPAE